MRGLFVTGAAVLLLFAMLSCDAPSSVDGGQAAVPEQSQVTASPDAKTESRSGKKEDEDEPVGTQGSGCLIFEEGEQCIAWYPGLGWGLCEVQVCGTGGENTWPSTPPGGIDWEETLPGCNDPSTITCDPYSGGGGGDPGGGSGNPDCDDPNIVLPPAGCEGEDILFLGVIILDQSLQNDSEAMCVYNKLTTGPYSNILTRILANFAGENTQFDLVIELADLGSSVNGNLLSSGASNPFYLQLNENRIDNRTPIEIATTLLHEAIHAEMRRYLYGATNTSTLPGFPGDFTEDWEHYILAKYDAITSGSVSAAEHNAMAQNYVLLIAQGLMEFDHFNQNYDFEHYEALAWNGLIGTEAWNNLSQSKQNELVTDYQVALQGRSLECN